MTTFYNEVWEDIFLSLPTMPFNPRAKGLPIAEIIKTIFFCLQEEIQDYNTAIALLDRISHLRKDVNFLNWKAMVEYDAKKFLRSFETSEKLLDYDKSGNMYFNVGRAAYKANRLEKSKVYLKKAMELLPGDSGPILDYAVTICSMGDFEGAFELIKGIDFKSDKRNNAIVEFNKGWHYLRKGDFKKGMELLHLGREIGVWGNHAGKHKKPQWDGQSHEGKTVLIIGEAGIGDEIINARFSKNIKDKGMNVIMSTNHKNESILSSITSLSKVINGKDVDNEKWDYWVPCMDLPFTLGIDESDLPTKPYIHSKPKYNTKWKTIIKSDKKLNIGIRWMGNQRYELELGRTIPLKYFEPLMDLDVQLWSIQKDDEGKGIRLPSGIIDISEGLQTWDDTLGAMKALDLVITSCTSIAHMGGALGVPTWAVVPLLPYYTWANMEKKSNWYETVTVYRQKEWQNWKHPFIELSKDLENLVATKNNSHSS